MYVLVHREHTQPLEPVFPFNMVGLESFFRGRGISHGEKIFYLIMRSLRCQFNEIPNWQVSVFSHFGVMKY